MRILFIYIFLLFLSLQTNAGNNFARNTFQRFPADTSSVRLRVPSKDKARSYKLDKEFRYDEVTQEPGLLDVIMAWISEQFRKLAATRTFGFIMKNFNYFIIALAAAIVIFILRKLKAHGIIYREEENGILKVSESGESIGSIDPDKMIAEAVERKEYRTAIRYCYIRSLKLLAARSLVELKVNKTNSQYVKELKEPDVKKLFEELTYVFEWIWYGEIPVQLQFFEAARTRFDKFDRLVAERK